MVDRDTKYCIELAQDWLSSNQAPIIVNCRSRVPATSAKKGNKGNQYGRQVSLTDRSTVWDADEEAKALRTRDQHCKAQVDEQTAQGKHLVLTDGKVQRLKSSNDSQRVLSSEL